MMAQIPNFLPQATQLPKVEVNCNLQDEFLERILSIIWPIIPPLHTDFSKKPKNQLFSY
jgi:hypothetical protein